MSTTHEPTQADKLQVSALLSKAKELIQNARFSNAIQLLQQLLENEFDNEDRIEALYMLAVSFRYNKNFEQALATLDTLLAEKADYSRAYQEQGHIFLSQNRSYEATLAYGKAVELNPSLLASWKALTNLYYRDGKLNQFQIAREQAEFLGQLPDELLSVTNFIYEHKLYKAEQLCRNFLQRNKHHIEAMRLLADIGIKLNIYDDAEFLLESCVEFAPDYIRARIDYLNILIKKTKFEKAHEQARLLLQQEPDNPGFMTSLATTLVGLGRYVEGIALYKKVIENFPNQSQLYLLTGHAQKTTGKLDEAIQSYKKAYKYKADFGDAFWSLANTKTYKFTDTEIAHIKQYESSADISIDDRIHMCFAMGKALEDRKDYETSFSYYERGNALKKEQTGYSPEKTEARVRAQIETCTRELFESRSTAGFQSSEPIFIVGLPRAGSTLLEQILASHSMVDGTMELHNILALAQKLRGREAENSPKYPRILNELDEGYFHKFGEQYIRDTQVYRSGAAFFIDKMPNNFLHIGLIRLILPNAKVIDARRHPMACCFSGFKQLFGEGQEFTYGLEEIGHYYNAYVRLMDHWDRVLPGFVLHVRHEDVVNDLNTQVRRILDFCHLPFEDNCINYHKTERSIRTPSSEQVKQPIYRSGLDQWRNFENQLAPLKHAIGEDILSQYGK